ncbi:MAG: cation:proton antiporter subunit C [Gammaproteobacteria bacterium]|nr:cation:proton antiporter subunit C [Gammaproteobacteria bacterium]
MIELIENQYNYWICMLLMMAGLYIVIDHTNLLKKLIGLNIFQTSVFILFISMGKLDGGTAPILEEGYRAFSNPLPHVLILTAIVVSVATTAVGLALVVSINKRYQSIDEQEIEKIELEEE